MDRMERIRHFSCPLWEAIPDQGLFNQEVVTHIQSVLEPIRIEEPIITSTMIQNYSKWHLIPRLTGRKYRRDQLAVLLILSIYKQVLRMDQVKQGMNLQLNKMAIQSAYNIFARSLNSAIQDCFKQVGNPAGLSIEGMAFSKDTEGVELVSRAYAFKLLATLIINSGGYQELGENHD
ncbi:DUF1836 domain-containing protein [Facklamia hominis]|uniref:DUF1836 domain-containing protein n=1 Tax=Facklamia hominis CCUG 36813 TaxID=883111 RepID=K1LAL2_9LACT|nr:DUF1836 domain-containing protein [Facklamia hominis]EKB53530.1 hypothetical protein HMPREF9706_01608 [Facklamia hominis CCUG 36813]